VHSDLVVRYVDGAVRQHIGGVETGSRVDTVAVGGTENAADGDLVARPRTAGLHVEQRALPGVAEPAGKAGGPVEVAFACQEERTECDAVATGIGASSPTAGPRAVDIG